KHVMDVVDTGIDGLPVLLGADFIYYGPIENSRLSFPYIAMVDKLIAEGAEDYFGQDIDEDHPYHKLL
ncbi:MAG: tetrahydromethanopterin S-methyltransferase subunit H, partial [Thermoplasmatota archaeon]